MSIRQADSRTTGLLLHKANKRIKLRILQTALLDTIPGNDVIYCRRRKHVESSFEYFCCLGNGWHPLCYIQDASKRLKTTHISSSCFKRLLRDTGLHLIIVFQIMEQQNQLKPASQNRGTYSRFEIS